MPHRLLRLVEVQRRVPYSRGAIYLMISRRDFPRQVSLDGRAVAWVESEVDDWIAARVGQRNEETPGRSLDRNLRVGRDRPVRSVPFSVR